MLLKSFLKTEAFNFHIPKSKYFDFSCQNNTCMFQFGFLPPKSYRGLKRGLLIQFHFGLNSG